MLFQMIRFQINFITGNVIFCVFLYDIWILHSLHYRYFVGGYSGNWRCELQGDFQIGACETHSRSLAIRDGRRCPRTATFRNGAEMSYDENVV